MKKHLTIDEAIKSIRFEKIDDAKHILQKHFPRDTIRCVMESNGDTTIHIGSQTRTIWGEQSCQEYNLKQRRKMK